MAAALRVLLCACLVPFAGCGRTPAARPADLDEALRMPEARVFIAAEAALQATAGQGPGEAFVAKAGDLRRAAEAWLRKLGETRDAEPDVQRLAEELDGVEVLVGPGLDPARAGDREVRTGIAAAVRQRLWSLREFRKALSPRPATDR